MGQPFSIEGIYESMALQIKSTKESIRKTNLVVWILIYKTLGFLHIKRPTVRTQKPCQNLGICNQNEQTDK